MAGTERGSAGCFHRDAGFEFLYEAHQETAAMPFACMRVSKALLTLSPSGKLTAEAGEGLALGRDQGHS